MAKYNIYAVAFGMDPKTKEQVSNLKFNSWNECKSYITNVPGAKYKGFLTTEEADVWLSNTINAINNQTERKVNNTNNLDNTQSITDISTSNNDYDVEFSNICKELGIFPKDVLTYLQKQFVQQYKFFKDNISEIPFDL